MTAPGRAVRRWIAVAALAPLLGCYRYVPVEPSAVGPGSDVRLSVARRALAEMPEEVPLSDTRLTGRLVAADAGALTLRVPVAARTRGAHRIPLVQDVVLARPDILSLEIRQLDRARTTLAVVGAAGAATGLVLMVIEASGRIEEEEPLPPNQIRIPLVSLPVP